MSKVIQGLKTTYPASEPITGSLPANVWTKNLDSNTRRVYLDIQNEDTSNDMRFQFVNNPFSLSFDAGDHVDIDTILAAGSAILTSPRGSLEATVRNPSSFSQVNTIISLGDTSANEYLRLYIDDSDKKVKAELRTAAAVQWSLESDTAVDAMGIDFTRDFYDIKILQTFAIDGSGSAVEPKLFVNGNFVDQTFTTSTDKTLWIPDIQANVDNARIGSHNVNGAGEADQYEDFIKSVVIREESDFNSLRELVRYNMGEGTGTTIADTGQENNAFTGTFGAGAAAPSWAVRSNGRVISKDTGREFVDNQCPQTAVWFLSAAASHGTVTLREG